MDLMGKKDLDNQMTLLQDCNLEEEPLDINHTVQDFRRSLRETVQEEIVKPKLQCLMMDPAFSMVTLQSEDSGILWETVSSRCTTPRALEISSPSPDLCNSLVSRCPSGPSLETAGKIVFIMDEDHMINRKKRKHNKRPDKLPMLADDKTEEPVRPAMVEVAVPNVRDETEKENKKKDSKEARKQRVFCLVSEGSEILNIVVPPKVSTVDEEESKALEDNLFYLEETPVIKINEVPEEPELYEATDKVAFPQANIQEVALTPIIKQAKKQGACEDYFEKFTLLDHQAPLGVPKEEENKEPETTSEQERHESDIKAIDKKTSMEIRDDPASITGQEIDSEHVDDVFYGSGQDSDFGNSRKCANNEETPTKLVPNKSGSALFGSQESVLTPVFLPEGPQKIVDLVLLEEPKAMAFMYSDLYAEAEGSRMKQDDTESVTSEKSFHSQESDLEDRGYLEKFVLKDETPVTPMNPLHTDREEDGVVIWSQDVFGLTLHDRLENERLDDADEITDFFRNSASSSPCEPIRMRYEVEPEKTKTDTKVRRVVFQDERQEKTTEEDVDIAEAFSPLNIGLDYKSVITEYAAKVCASTPSKSEKTKRSSKALPSKTDLISIHIPQTVKPVTPNYKPFLELTPLLPVEIPEEEEKQVKGSDNVFPSATVEKEDGVVEASDYTQHSQKKKE